MSLFKLSFKGFLTENVYLDEQHVEVNMRTSWLAWHLNQLNNPALDSKASLHRR